MKKDYKIIQFKKYKTIKYMTSNEQVAQMIQIITKLQKQEDFHTTKNIVADKTIYAKKGLHVGDFNIIYTQIMKEHLNFELRKILGKYFESV